LSKPKKQRWVACVGDHRSAPLTVDETKTAARSLLNTKVRAEPRDWIEELNQIAANEVDRAEIARQRRKWPVDLMGGKRGKLNEEERQLRQVILDTERVLTDERQRQRLSEAITFSPNTTRTGLQSCRTFSTAGSLSSL
jgi:hypothetical protein